MDISYEEAVAAYKALAEPLLLRIVVGEVEEVFATLSREDVMVLIVLVRAAQDMGVFPIGRHEI